MNKIVSFFKEHPYGIAGGVFAIGILWLIFATRGSGASAGGGTTVIGGQDAASTQAATAFQIAQLQAGTAQSAQQAHSTDVLNALNGQIAIDTIQAKQSTDNTNISAQVASLLATLTATTSQAQIAAQASVINNQTTAQLQESLAQTAALQNISLAPYEVQLAELNSHAGGNSADHAQIQAILDALSNTGFLAELQNGQQVNYQDQYGINVALQPGYNLPGFTTAGQNSTYGGGTYLGGHPVVLPTQGPPADTSNPANSPNHTATP